MVYHSILWYTMAFHEQPWYTKVIAIVRIHESIRRGVTQIWGSMEVAKATNTWESAFYNGPKSFLRKVKGP